MNFNHTDRLKSMSCYAVIDSLIDPELEVILKHYQIRECNVGDNEILRLSYKAHSKLLTWK